MPNSPKTIEEQTHEIEDLSGGMQVATTTHVRKRNEMELVQNGDFGEEIGGIGKSLGYAKRANDLTSTTTTSTSTSTTTTSTSTSTSTTTSTSTSTTA